MTEQSSATHWASYSTDEGLSFLPEDGRTLMISVVLDAGAERHYEGIRVLIVQRNEGSEISVTGCTNLARSSRVTGLSYRKALIASRTQGMTMDHCVHTTGDENFCTIIFELAPSQTYWGQFARLVLMGHRTSQPYLRIIYNHTERRVSSTTFFLHCSHSAQPDFSPGGNIRKPTRVRMHFVRVLPVTKNRPSWTTFNLPQPLLSRIISFAFSDKQKGWRKGLLSCSLVCKSWAYLVDFFLTDFEGVGLGYDHDPPNISAVARSLQQNPSRAPLIMTYSPAQYLRPMIITKTVFRTFCEAQNTILRYATSLQDVAIESTHAFLFHEFYDILCGLREVSNLQVTSTQRFGPRDTGDIRHLFFEEILKIVSLCPHLRKLSIINFKVSSVFNFPPSSGARTETAEITCPIENLNLGIGVLQGPLLMRLTGPLSSPATIRIARFDAIKGLTNSDFLAFLLRVSPTLESLFVSACPMWRNSDDEEYAIDAAMPSLTSLETLGLEGDLSSEKALIRKVRRKQDKGNTQNRHQISLFSPKMVQLDVVMDAVSVTGWDSIFIHLDTPVGYSPQLVAEVTQAAKAKGVVFDFLVGTRGH